METIPQKTEKIVVSDEEYEAILDYLAEDDIQASVPDDCEWDECPSCGGPLEFCHVAVTSGRTTYRPWRCPACGAAGDDEIAYGQAKAGRSWTVGEDEHSPALVAAGYEALRLCRDLYEGTGFGAMLDADLYPRFADERWLAPEGDGVDGR